MSFCDVMYGCCRDDTRENLNFLTRVNNFYPERTAREDLAIKVVGCVSAPLKCLEGLGMICCGAILTPCFCIDCRVDTYHEGQTVSVSKIYPECRSPNIPCHFEDAYTSNGQTTSHRGWGWRFQINPRPTGQQPKMFASSSMTSVDCLTGGAGKIASVVINMLCLPVNCFGLAFCNPND